MTLTDASIAALADHEAVPLGYPRHMDAWMVVQLQGRMDSPRFSVQLSLEPTQHARPWVVYQRRGALLQVGEHAVRLNPAQWRLFLALEAMWQAGDDVAARLAAWPALHSALQASTQQRIRVMGEIPRIVLQHVATLPPASRTRADDRLCPVRAVPQTRWSMGPGRRYYLQGSA